MAIRIERSGISCNQGFGLMALGPEQKDSIHLTSLQVLENVGIKVESRTAMEALVAAGCIAKPLGEHFLVKIPQHVVSQCLFTAPKTVTYRGRNPQQDFVAEPGRVGFATFGECIGIIDPETRQHRPSTKRDCADIARLADCLEEIIIMERTVCPCDCPPHTQPLHNFAATVANTGMHIFLGVGDRRNLEVMAELAKVAAGGEDSWRERTLFTANVCPTSPLTLVNGCCQAIMGCAELGLGIMIVPMALSGGSAPVTLAGTVAQHNAEILAAVTLSQITRPGAPCTYGSCTSIMDLRTAVSAVGAPEYGILNACISQMAQYYGLPSWVGGGLSDAKTPDAQVGYEFTVNALTSALSGANIVYGSGALELGLTFDYAKLMMDHDCMRYIRKVLNGVTVDNHHLAYDEIEQVGPSGSFLMQRHTLGGMRSQSSPEVFDRSSREAWSKKGARDARDVAYARAAERLAGHRPHALPEGAEQEMEAIIWEYEKELGLAR